MSHSNSSDENEHQRRPPPQDEEDATKKQDEKKIRSIQPRLQREVITNIRPRDVLPGVNHNRHPGNVYFRKLIKGYELEYANTAKRDRAGIARAIVDEIMSKSGDHPPGRFLKEVDEARSTSMGRWYDMGYDKAFAKTRHALIRCASIIKKNNKREEHERRRQLHLHHQMQLHQQNLQQQQQQQQQQQKHYNFCHQFQDGENIAAIFASDQNADNSSSTCSSTRSHRDSVAGKISGDGITDTSSSSDRVMDAADDNRSSKNGNNNKKRRTSSCCAIYEGGMHNNNNMQVAVKQEDEDEKWTDDSTSIRGDDEKIMKDHDTCGENGIHRGTALTRWSHDERNDELEENRSDKELAMVTEEDEQRAEEGDDDEELQDDKAEEIERNIEREEAILKLENAKLNLRIAQHDAMSNFISQIMTELDHHANHSTLRNDDEMKEILRTSILDMMKKRADVAKNISE